MTVMKIKARDLKVGDEIMLANPRFNYVVGSIETIEQGGTKYRVRDWNDTGSSIYDADHNFIVTRK